MFRYSIPILLLACASDFELNSMHKKNGHGSEADGTDVGADHETQQDEQNDEDGFEVSDEILAIVGDIDYGEYLSSECTTCHHAQGLDEGIPSITGWPIESFVWALHSYKSGARNHPIMEMITQRLSNEEIASLAIFFESINN